MCFPVLETMEDSRDARGIPWKWKIHLIPTHFGTYCPIKLCMFSIYLLPSACWP